MQKFEKESKIDTIDKNSQITFKVCKPLILLFSFFMQKILLSLSLLVILSACSMTGDDSSRPTVSAESRTIAVPTYGSGKHTVEIFADFQCPACINFSNVIGPIIE